MHLRLRLCNNPENPAGQLLCPLRHLCAINNRKHVLQRAVLMRMPVMAVMVIVVVVMVIVVVVMVIIVVVVVIVVVVRMSVVIMMIVMVVMVFLRFRRSLSEQISHIMIMVLVLMIQQHIEINRRNPALLHLRNLNVKALRRDRLQHLLQLLLVCTKIQQCTCQHIAADSGITFQI